MSMEPTWNQGAEPPPPKKSGSKAWLIIGVVLGVCVLLCCGGVIGLGVYFASKASTDPVAIGQSLAESVEITVPNEIPPRFRLDMGAFGQRVALLIYFQAPGSDNFVWIAQSGNNMQLQTQGDADKMRPLLESQLVAQSQAVQAGNLKSLQNAQQREVEVTTNGKTSKLTLSEGEDSDGKKLVQVKGMFEGKGGPAYILVQLEADKFPPEKVEEMLKSMK